MFSFLKGEKAEKEIEPQPGVLAVWGSGGSGKSTVSAKIAQHLASKKQNVVLLLCNATAPMLPCICKPQELECEYSLGRLLTNAHITQSLIKEHLITLKRNPYLTILGMKKGENEYTHRTYSALQVQELIAELPKIAPFIVVDCTSNIVNDLLSMVSILNADNVLRLSTADLKSISYFSSQIPVLRKHGFDEEKQYKVASNVREGQATEAVAQAQGAVAFTLPYSQELNEQYLSGNLLSELQMKDSREFRREISAIVKEVFGV